MPADWRYAARELAKELYCKSREFYEFVMLAIDMTEGDDDLVVTINLPGFVKKDINLRIVTNVLYIGSKRESR
jgi:HSP20 family molecular chaperone IbpA